jgi:hypothetical protein
MKQWASARVEKNDGKLFIRSGSCPLATAVAEHPDVWRVAESLLAGLSAHGSESGVTGKVRRVALSSLWKSEKARRQGDRFARKWNLIIFCFHRTSSQWLRLLGGRFEMLLH